ncbi:hypothetical protein CF54_14420 [Streptomyces sp. Tu 6176]|uniref:DUF3558 family protein n=1 Tax=Streptomyces sp. Tu 6176 TaxID=1470557 RepID=UPI0004508847|nr:DUF3558 family protein [Streptomyces sp. Tu 6176]EYT82264.1 hypothetical protein CF54_14420 [Streptomyces sp. Tu 6176]
MRGRSPLLVCAVAPVIMCFGAVTGCSSGPSGGSGSAPPAARPADVGSITPCDFFTGDELSEYALHDARPVSDPPGCLWEGSVFFEGASTALTLTLLPRSADAELRTLRTASGERITERSAIGGRRIWRNTTPGNDVRCELLFSIDGSSAAVVRLSEFLGVSDVRPTQQDLCDGLDKLAPRVEGKLPAVRS